MDLTLIQAIIITIIAIIFSALFSGTEIAFMQSNKVKMQIDAARGGLVDRILTRFNTNADMFISTLLVGNNVVVVVYGIAISCILNPLLARVCPNDAFVLVTNTAISTIIMLFTGEFIPKSAFRINPNIAMRLLALPMMIIYTVFYPVSLFANTLSKGMMRLVGIKDTQSKTSLLTIEQLDDYVQRSIETEADKEEVENEVKIFRNAIDFKDTQVRECMIPRNEMVAVDIAQTTTEELTHLFVTSGLSKIVVYKEDIDNIIGYIHVSELFRPENNWKESIRPVIFTPETMLANKMMRRMMSEKRTLAVVVDEFGGTSGLITLEDLVEEIFGEIEDEHDRKRSLSRKRADGVMEISGRAEIERINEKFNLHLPESDDYHTLAGYILENLESLPAQGDKFTLGTYDFEILRMSATRIELVAISGKGKEPEDE